MGTRFVYGFIQSSQASDIVSDASRRIQINSLERTHKRPSPTEPVAHCFVDVFTACNSVFDECHSFPKQNTLQSIQNKAFNLFANVHDALPQRVHEFVYKPDGFRRGCGGRNKFNHRYQVGRLTGGTNKKREDIASPSVNRDDGIPDVELPTTVASSQSLSSSSNRARLTSSRSA